MIPVIGLRIRWEAYSVGLPLFGIYCPESSLLLSVIEAE
jgi:hypothetical protein